MLGESLLTLAALAGRLVVDAADSDGWATAERGYAQLLGRGNAKQAKLARRWLEETREQLSGGPRADMEMIRMALAGRWGGGGAAAARAAPAPPRGSGGGARPRPRPPRPFAYPPQSCQLHGLHGKRGRR